MSKLSPSRVTAKLARSYNELRIPKPELMPLPPIAGRPRVLYFMAAYPNFSETYMHEEIRSLCNDFEIKLVTYQKSERPRLHAWEYTRIDYKAPCLVYAPIQQIDQTFSEPRQQAFIRRVSAVIEEFKPDVMHGHYLGLAILLRHLAEKHNIPFTIRSHSMDNLSEPEAKLRAVCEAANSPWCKRVLAFPQSCERLVQHGLDPQKAVNTWPIVAFQRFYRPEKRPRTGGVICEGPAITKKAHNQFIDLAASMKQTHDFHFDLFAAGPRIEQTRRYNEQMGRPVTITYADPDVMPDVYPRYDWLVYPSDPDINKVGLPVSIGEAMAAGIGVCWQELPGRRQEQLDFLGGAGYLFQSLDDLPGILAEPYPEDRRQKGFAAAARCDSVLQKHLLADIWQTASSQTGLALAAGLD